MKKYVLGGVIIFCITLACYLLFFNGTSKQDTLPAGQVQRVVKVTRGDLYLNVSSDGVVQPINKVELRSKAGGKIVQLSFIEGQYVKQGDLLILVDQTITKNNLDQANADLETARASLHQATNTDKRTQELFLKGLVSQQEVDQSNTDLVRAQAQLVKAKAALSNAEDQMNDTRIVAPVSGIVLSKNVELGQLISSATSNVGGGTLLASVADMNDVYVYAKVDEVDIGKVKAGQKVAIVADAYPEDTFEGTVERIASQGLTQQNVTTFDVIVLVRNEGWKLKAGMSTSVDIQVFNKMNVLLLPNEAFKDPKSDQGKDLLVEGNLVLPSEGSAIPEQREKDSAKDFEKQKRQERFQNVSEQERESIRKQRRERVEKMSPEEREKLRTEWRQNMEQRGEKGTAQSIRPRRPAQGSNNNEVRWRIAVVKDGEAYKPRLVKTAASNFDNTEIVEGLKEGDEIQITSISRAKIASERMTERIRSSSPLGGSGSGGGGHAH